MPPDEESLSTRLERLEICGSPSAKGCSGKNPFRSARRRTRSRGGRGGCRLARVARSTVAFKGKAVTGATGVSAACPCSTDPSVSKSCRGCMTLKEVKSEMHSLVSDCNRLKISDDSDGRDRSKSAPSPSCSQQALNLPCDVTIDELASYFETFVHIPKKMTTMAEMMYT